MQFHDKTLYVWGLRYWWDPSLSMNPVRRFAHFTPLKITTFDNADQSLHVPKAKFERDSHDSTGPSSVWLAWKELYHLIQSLTIILTTLDHSLLLVYLVTSTLCKAGIVACHLSQEVFGALERTAHMTWESASLYCWCHSHTCRRWRKTHW